MTAKITDRERWRRELSRWIAKSGVPAMRQASPAKRARTPPSFI